MGGSNVIICEKSKIVKINFFKTKFEHLPFLSLMVVLSYLLKYIVALLFVGSWIPIYLILVLITVTIQICSGHTQTAILRMQEYLQAHQEEASSLNCSILWSHPLLLFYQERN